MYVDSRTKKLTSERRYGGKVQLHNFDEMVSRYGNGTPQFMLAVLRTRLMNGIKYLHEMLARNALLEWAQFAFLANGTPWNATSANWSDLTATSTYQVDIKFIEDVRLRLSERSKEYLQEWGTYAQPVPGAQFARDLLVITTPGVIYDIWNSPSGQWVEDLYSLQDQRIINGGMFRYKGVTFVENRDTARLYNCGPITRQVGVTSPILWGDGSPDPDTTAVDNVWYVGQGSTGVTHYIQCDDLGTSAFVQGDRITIHTARTTTYGVTDGVNPFDGETYEAIINSVDEATERITLTQPMTQEYRQSFTATPVSTAVGVFYAFITKGRSIHPIYVIGARGIHTFAARQGIKVYNPEDNQADLPGVVRVTWDEYGQFNRWNPYPYEILYAVASDTVSGYAQAALR